MGNKGYRKFLKVSGNGHFTIDERKIEEEARYDGTRVLRTNTSFSAEDVARKYKQLWKVEDLQIHEERASHSADLSQSRRHDTRPSVLQLSRLAPPS
jgi:hypothetical protein